jgi:hypothetical protein
VVWRRVGVRLEISSEILVLDDGRFIHASSAGAHLYWTIVVQNKLPRI